MAPALWDVVGAGERGDVLLSELAFPWHLLWVAGRAGHHPALAGLSQPVWTDSEMNHLEQTGSKHCERDRQTGGPGQWVVREGQMGRRTRAWCWADLMGFQEKGLLEVFEEWVGVVRGRPFLSEKQHG